jgi:chromosome segregation ATPase
MKTLSLLTAALLTVLTSAAVAETMNASQGLDKIKNNLENSKANQKEYERNLTVVNQNINEVNKAKSSILKQKESVSTEIVKNNDSLKKVMIQERDISVLLTQEKEKLAAEAKQVEQLEKMMAQIKQNQQQRESIIADYQNQLRMTSDEKKAWKDRETELRNQEAKTIQSVRALASEESTWNNKKKGYEGETKRWAAEAEKQQKIHDTYQGLAEQNK